MKTSIAFALLLMTCVLASQERLPTADPALPASFTTLAGKTYTGVALRSVEPDGVRITHDSGLAKIKFEELPIALRSQFAMDPEKAAAYRAEQAAALAAAAKLLAAEKARITKEANTPTQAPAPLAASPTMQSSVVPGTQTTLPPPTGGKIYTVDELKTKRADLAGKVVRVKLAANSSSTAEQNEDGSFDVFVGGAASGDDYTSVKFPKEARTYVRLFNKTARGEMTFFALVSAGRSGWLRIVGRGFNGRTYDW